MPAYQPTVTLPSLLIHTTPLLSLFASSWHNLQVLAVLLCASTRCSSEQPLIESDSLTFARKSLIDCRFKFAFWCARSLPSSPSWIGSAATDHLLCARNNTSSAEFGHPVCNVTCKNEKNSDFTMSFVPRKCFRNVFKANCDELKYVQTYVRWNAFRYQFGSACMTEQAYVSYEENRNVIVKCFLN